MDGRNKRILMIDDDDVIRRVMLLSGAVALPGFDFVGAEDGVQALALLEERHDWDLIVSDVLMPKMDGVALLGELAAHPIHARIPVVVLSTIDPKQLPRERYPNVVAWLRKPCALGALWRTVREHAGS